MGDGSYNPDTMNHLRLSRLSESVLESDTFYAQLDADRIPPKEIRAIIMNIRALLQKHEEATPLVKAAIEHFVVVYLYFKLDKTVNEVARYTGFAQRSVIEHYVFMERNLGEPVQTLLEGIVERFNQPAEKVSYEW